MLTASVLGRQDRCKRRNAMGRLPTWAQLSILAAAVLLSPVLALLTAIAVEIVIGVLVDAGAFALPALRRLCCHRVAAASQPAAPARR